MAWMPSPAFRMNSHERHALLMVRLEQEVCPVVNVPVEPVELAGVGEHLVNLEVRVVPAPDHQRGPLMIAMIGCYLRKTGNVAAIVGEDAELYLNQPRPADPFPVEMPALGREQRLEPIRDVTDLGVPHDMR